MAPFSHWECPLLFPYFKKSLSFHTLALIPHCLSPLELYPLYIGHPKLHPPLYNPFSRNPLYTINPFTQTPTPYTTLQSPLSHDYPYTTTPSYNPHPIQPLWLYIILIKCQKNTSPFFARNYTLIEHFTSSKNTSPFSFITILTEDFTSSICQLFYPSSWSTPILATSFFL